MINSNPTKSIRSCLCCNLLSKCHTSQEVDSPFIWCDKAKYGCTLYTSDVDEYINELPKKKDKQY